MTDLLEELRDGHVLLSLLEVLLGTTLVSLLIANVSMHVYLFRFCSKKTNKQKIISRLLLRSECGTLQLALRVLA